MNKSFSKKRHIQEANQRLEERLLSEQVKATLTPSQQPSVIQPTTNVKSATINPTKGSMPVDPHDSLEILQIGALLIPVVGPFISAGLGLADAAIYAKEGKNTEAGVATFFALLPAIGSVVSKIPGVKQLGQKGMQLLASKLLTKAPLNAVEQGVIKGINLNKELIKQETNSVVKNMAANAATRTTDTVIKKELKNIAKEGIEVGAEEIAMNMASSSPSQKAVGTGIKQAVGTGFKQAVGKNPSGIMASAAAAVSGRYQSLKPKS